MENTLSCPRIQSQERSPLLFGLGESHGRLFREAGHDGAILIHQFDFERVGFDQVGGAGGIGLDGELQQLEVAPGLDSDLRRAEIVRTGGIGRFI